MKKLIIKILVSISKKLGYKPESEFGMVEFVVPENIRRKVNNDYEIFLLPKSREYMYRGASYGVVRIDFSKINQQQGKN